MEAEGMDHLPGSIPYTVEGCGVAVNMSSLMAVWIRKSDNYGQCLKA